MTYPSLMITFLIEERETAFPLLIDGRTFYCHYGY